MNALQPVYQLTDRTILQDFVNALLVEELIPEQYVVDFETAQAKLSGFDIDLEQYLNERFEQQYFVLLLEQQSKRCVFFPVNQGIAQPWCFFAESEIILVDQMSDQGKLQSIELLELFQYLQDMGVFQHCQTNKIQNFA